MSDLATQIRVYLDDTAPPVTLDEIFTERIGVLPLQPTRPRPIPVGARGPLIAIAAAVVVLVIGAAAAILTLSGDGGNDVVAASPTTPGPITSFDDIAGTIYQRQGSGSDQYMYFLEDGTIHGSSNPDFVVDRPFVVFQTSFEETKILITTANLFCPDQPDQDSTYELLVLENGNLMFVAVDEDSCGQRSGNFSNTEWVPVP